MLAMRYSTAALPATLCLAIFSQCCSIQAVAQSIPEEDRLQQAVTWMNTVVVTEPVSDLRAYTPDQKAALIADLQKWMKSGSAIGSAELPATSTPAEKPKREINETMVFPEKGSLWLLVPQIKTDVSEASKWVYGVPYGSPKGSANAFYPNPDSYLFTGTATFNFAQAFLSISDRQKLCDAVTESDRSEGTCKNIGFLMGSRDRDSWERLLSAVTLISTTSQNPRFSQGLVPEAGTVSYEKTFSETVTGSFDATKLFRTATDYKNGLDIQAGASKTLGYHEVDLPTPCKTSSVTLTPKIKKAANKAGEQPDEMAKDIATQACIDAIAYGSGHWQKMGKMLIPTIEVKAVTASDLAKSGANTYIQPPSQIPALYSFSATWDLRKYIPSATTLSDAAAVMQAAAPASPSSAGGGASAAPVSAAKPDPDVKWKGQVAWFCIQLISHPEVVSNDGWWTRFQDAILGGGVGTANSSVAQVKLDTTSP